MFMALQDVKVIDVSQVAAVPMCARHLADFGADVIHIESAKTGDSWRNLQAGAGGGPAGIPSDIPYNWEAYNRNKKSVALDLSKEAGRKIIYKLVENADVFVTNLRLSERKKFDLGYETLKKLNPRLIYGSVTGHGMKGPDKDMPAYDTTVYWARSGVNHLLTIPGMSGPNPRPAFGDNVAGLGLAFGVMAALYARDRIGEGQEVDISLLYTGVYQLTFDMAGALATGQDENEYRVQAFEGTEEERQRRDKLMAEAQEALRRLGDFYRERLPNPLANTYETRDGKLIRFNALQADRYWTKFCRLLGIEDLEHDPRFATMDARQENRKELYHIFREAFLSKTLAEWQPLISDLPGSPIQSLLDIVNDPQAEANSFFLPYDHPSYGLMRIMASPVNLSGTPASIRMPAPEFSQHTEEVLLEAGYTWEEIAQFKEEKVIP
ncbi:MAG: CoA transferase [Deltaproteobacteria bacterium]|nr:CoA transferase [Deltaproteobacteria bacterium]MBW2085733.1 CoA transferase [Deltaproteobacteria bacterium]